MTRYPKINSEHVGHFMLFAETQNSAGAEGGLGLKFDYKAPSQDPGIIREWEIYENLSFWELLTRLYSYASDHSMTNYYHRSLDAQKRYRGMSETCDYSND